MDSFCHLIFFLKESRINSTDFSVSSSLIFPSCLMVTLSLVLPSRQPGMHFLTLMEMPIQLLILFWIRCSQKDSFTNRSWKEKVKTRKWWREAAWRSPVHLPAEGCAIEVCERNHRHCLDWSRISWLFCYLWVFSLPIHRGYKLDERW